MYGLRTYFLNRLLRVKTIYKGRFPRPFQVILPGDAVMYNTYSRVDVVT